MNFSDEEIWRGIEALWAWRERWWRHEYNNEREQEEWIDLGGES